MRKRGKRKESCIINTIFGAMLMQSASQDVLISCSLGDQIGFEIQRWCDNSAFRALVKFFDVVFGKSNKYIG